MHSGFFGEILNTLKVTLLSRVQLFATPWTVDRGLQAHQAPLPMVLSQARILVWVVISSPRGSS